MTFNQKLLQKANGLSNNFWEPINSEDTGIITFYYILWSEWFISVSCDIYSAVQKTRSLQRALLKVRDLMNLTSLLLKIPIYHKECSFPFRDKKALAQRAWINCSRSHNKQAVESEFERSSIRFRLFQVYKVRKDLQIEEY